MAFAMIFGPLSLLFILFLVLLPIALLVLFQVWLCRKGKWLGLILPGISLMLSLLLVFSMAVFTRPMEGTLTLRNETTGEILQEEHHAGGHTISPGDLLTAGVLFLVYNIPTIVFGGIWLHYKGRRDVLADLEKMRLQDLE